jgi:ribosomal protein S18 acetylase RimI-like enzyme
MPRPSADTSDPPPCRRARPGDLDSLLDIENGAFSGDRISRRQMRYHLRNPRARIWICERGGAPAAYLLALFPAARAPRIYSVATLAAHRGHGLAGRLIDAAARAAKKEGYGRILLEVRQDAPAVIAFYEGRGFRKARSLPAYYEDGTDGWKMIKELDRRRGVQ